MYGQKKTILSCERILLVHVLARSGSKNKELLEKNFSNGDEEELVYIYCSYRIRGSKVLLIYWPHDAVANLQKVRHK